MRKRTPSSRKSKLSPLPMASQSPTHESPKSAIFNKIATGSSLKSKTRDLSGKVKAINNSKISRPMASPPVNKSLSSINELKDFASSQLEHLRRHLDRSHSEISKDVEGSQSRLHKRFKIQTQAAQEVTEEVEKEYKKIAEQISETRKAMKATFVEFMEDAQKSSSHVCKTSIPELSQSYEKAIDALRNRFGISTT